MIRRVFDNPRHMTRITGILIVVAVLEWVVAGVEGWVNSVAYVSHLSQLAIVISLIPWWQGTRVETHQVEVDIPDEVVSRLVKDTEINSA